MTPSQNAPTFIGVLAAFLTAVAALAVAATAWPVPVDVAVVALPIPTAGLVGFFVVQKRYTDPKGG